MKVSVFTVMCPDLDLQETIDVCKASGADGIEWRVREIPPDRRGGDYSFWGNHKNDLPPAKFVETAEDIRKRCDDAGLAIPNIASYVGYASDADEVKMVAEGAAKCGAASFRCGPARYDGSRAFDELYRETVEGYERIVEIIRPFGVKALIETHPDIITPSASAARRIVENFSSTEVGVIHDPGNMVNEGYEQWKMGFEILGDYLSLVHAKNASRVAYERREDGIVPWGGKSVPLGDGGADWRAIVDALKAVGYEGFLSLEDFTTDVSSAEKIERDVKFLKEVIAAAGA